MNRETLKHSIQQIKEKSHDIADHSSVKSAIINLARFAATSLAVLNINASIVNAEQVEKLQPKQDTIDQLVQKPQQIEQSREVQLTRLRVLMDKNSQAAYKKRVEGLRSGVKNPGKSENFNNGLTSDGVESPTFNIAKTTANSTLITVLKPGENPKFPDGLSHLYTESSTAAISQSIKDREINYTVKYPTDDMYIVIGAQVNSEQIPPPATAENPSPEADGKLRTLFPGFISPVVINSRDGNFYLNPESPISTGGQPDLNPDNLIPSGNEVSKKSFENTVTTDEFTRKAELFGQILPDGTVQRGSGFVLGGKVSSTNLQPNFEKNTDTTTDLELSATYQRDLRGLNPQTGSFEIATDTRSLRLSDNYSPIANLAATIPWVLQKPNENLVTPEPYRGSFSGSGRNDQQLKTRAYLAHSSASELAPEVLNRGIHYTNADKNGNVFSLIGGIGSNQKTYVDMDISETYKPFGSNPLRSTISINEPFDSGSGEVISNSTALSGGFNGQVGIEVLSGDGLYTLNRTEKYTTVVRDEIFVGGLFSQSRSNKVPVISNGVDPVFDIKGKLAMVQSRDGSWVLAGQAAINIYPTQGLQLNSNIVYSATPDVYSPNSYSFGVSGKLGNDIRASLTKTNYFDNQNLKGLRFDNSLNLGLEVKLSNTKFLNVGYDIQNQSGSVSLLHTNPKNTYRVGTSFTHTVENGDTLGLGGVYKLNNNSFISTELNYTWGSKNTFLPSESFNGVVRYNASF
jgi:hypothetical protein